MKISPRSHQQLSDEEAALARVASLVESIKSLAPDELIDSKRSDVCRYIVDTANRYALGSLGAYFSLNQAIAYRALGKSDEAERSYQEALHRCPDKGWWYFEQGLFYKWKGKWQDAFDSFNQAARYLGDHKLITWNQGICATSLGYAKHAQKAWQSLGLKTCLRESGDWGVPDLDLANIRVPIVESKMQQWLPNSLSIDNDPKQQHFEQLIVAPQSPCYGVVVSPSFHQEHVDYGDQVIWDHHPVSVRRREDKLLPCFPILSVVSKGEALSLPCLISDSQGMKSLFEEALGDMANLFVALQKSQCLYGKIVVYQRSALPKLALLIERFTQSHRHFRISIPRLHEFMGNTKQAGIDHRLWQALEPSSV